MPNFHPFFVHFPIALLASGLCLDAWATVRSDSRSWVCGGWLQAAGSAGLVAALATGILAAQSVGIPEGATGTLELHQQTAFISAVVFSALSFWRLGARGVIEGTRRVWFLLLYAAGVAGILFTGWLGGDLVFRYAVGVAGR